MVTIKAQKLVDFVADIFARAGSSNEEAKRVATYLTAANLTGHDSHGVIRVPRYVKSAVEGVIKTDQTIEVVIDAPSFAVIDGRFGFGQTVTPQAIRIGIDKCKAQGLSMIALRNSGHLGRVGDWAEMAAAENLVSIYFVNAAGSVLVAPFGGVERRLSTAPYCVGVPRKGQGPIVLDFATSLVAEGKVLVASRGGKKLPGDALVGPDGAISGDPHLLYGDYTPDGPREYLQGKGAIRAFGDHKGSGLALMCELLGGALTGNGATDPGKRWSQGMFSFYVDPGKVDPAHFLPAELSRFLSYVKGTRPIDPASPVLLPGEPEARMRAERTANGVPLTQDTFAGLIATAREVGMPDLAIRELTEP